MHHTHDSNNIQLLIASIIIQVGLWINDLFSTMTLHGLAEALYDVGKLGAIGFSIWASYKVGKKHDK